MAAPEIRLGSLENLPNIQLGSVQVEEVRLGNVLVWRNNIPPFFNLLVNGTLVDTNGTPMTPEDPDDPATAVLTVFEYTDTINIEAQGVVDSDLHYPVSIDLYNGDFDIDDTLPSLASGSVATASGSVTLRIPRGPQPTGANAADFIYADRLYSLVAVDNEDAASIIYFRITITDSADTPVFTAFSNSGPLMTGLTSFSTATGLTTTTNTQCFNAMSTTTTFDRTTETTFNRQPQSRTCSRQIVGVMDTAFDPCAGATLTQNVDTTTSTSPTDTITGTTMQPNGAYVTGATPTNTVGSPGPIAGTPTVSVGACMEPAGGCAFRSQNCTNGSATTMTQNTQFSTNCAGNSFGAAMPVGPMVPGTQTCTTASNSGYVAPTASGSSCGITSGGDDVVIRTNLGGGYTGWNGRVSATCMDGSTVTRGCSEGSSAGSCSPITFCGGSMGGIASASVEIFTNTLLNGVSTPVSVASGVTCS